MHFKTFEPLLVESPGRLDSKVVSSNSHVKAQAHDVGAVWGEGLGPGRSDQRDKGNKNGQRGVATEDVFSTFSSTSVHINLFLMMKGRGM